MSRARPSLRPPPEPSALGTFPKYRLTGERKLWRMVRDGLGPWWFGSSGASRFDLRAPNGTCYVASDTLGAMLETLGPDLREGGIAPLALLRGRHLQRLAVPTALKLANALSAQAARWISAELSTLTPYVLPQAWAQALHAAGFNGIRYAPRHATSRRPFSVALFGRAGDASEHASWPEGEVVPLTAEHRRRLRESCGVTLFDTPFADELDFVRSP